MWLALSFGTLGCKYTALRNICAAADDLVLATMEVFRTVLQLRIPFSI
jgi:hypothetical protein